MWGIAKYLMGIAKYLMGIAKYLIYGEVQNTSSMMILVKHNLHTKVDSNGEVQQNNPNGKLSEYVSQILCYHA
jgi:hypothetical protein